MAATPVARSGKMNNKLRKNEKPPDKNSIIAASNVRVFRKYLVETIGELSPAVSESVEDLPISKKTSNKKKRNRKNQKNLKDKQQIVRMYPTKDARKISCSDWIDQNCPKKCVTSCSTRKDLRKALEACDQQRLKHVLPASSEYIVVKYACENLSWLWLPPESRRNARPEAKIQVVNQTRPKIITGYTQNHLARKKNSGHVNDEHIVPGEGPKFNESKN